MPEFDEKYSELLVECGGNLVPFLDSIFGFLYRRSDFFRQKDQNQSESVIGFTTGQNKNLLLAVFNKWENFAKDERNKDFKLSQADVPPAIHEEEVFTDTVIEPKPKPIQHKKKPKKGEFSFFQLMDYVN